MLNILFVGPYKEDRLSNDLILSLNKANCNLFCKNFVITPKLETIDPIIIDLEKKTIPSKIDVLIQCIPPLFMEYHRSCGLNVGILNLPTKNPPISWTNKANLLDFHLTTNEISLDKPSKTFFVGHNPKNYKPFSKIKEVQEFGKHRFLFYLFL